MAATLDTLGENRQAVLEHFAAKLRADGQTGAVSLGAVAHVAVGVRTVIIDKGTS